MTDFTLEERTAVFGENILKILKTLPSNTFTKPLISQLIRSSTSVGANYCEANGASSKKDFRNKIHICKKEVQETKHWLRMLSSVIDDNIKKEDLRVLWQEAQELTLIFGKITGTMNNKKSK
ncbi:MAG TPA: four helix bundle protein [Candidatus Moranbacteria bacterium]|nr:four helix bundle protein [Candidatus Moranbacteria bacterium]